HQAGAARENVSILVADPIERVGRMKRRTFLRAGLATTALSLSPALGAHREETDKSAPSATETPVKPFEFEEITIADLQEAMRAGRHTSHTITEAYLERIREVDKEGP